jgi:LacI family transcriptional regulator
MASQVTIKDVAIRAGVSRSTAGLVLADHPLSKRLSADTRSKILAAAAEITYRPNTSARAIRNGSFGSVTLLLSTSHNRSIVDMDMIDGIHDALSKAGMHLVLARIPDEQLLSEDFVPKILRECVSDGLIINYVAYIPEKFTELLQRYKIPAIWTNLKQDFDSVYPDDYGAALAAVTSLIAKGHKKFAFVGYDTPHYSAQDRLQGFLDGLTGDLPDPRLYFLPVDHPEPYSTTYSNVLPWFLSEEPPTAVFCYNQPMCYAPWDAAVDAGLDAPFDPAIVTFDSGRTFFRGNHAFTMVLDRYSEGRTAVDLLLRKIALPDVAIPSVSVPLTATPVGPLP